jgi:hydroxyacylglutathione hydrolase
MPNRQCLYAAPCAYRAWNCRIDWPKRARFPFGFDNVAGYLQRGLHSRKSRPELIAFTERLSPQMAAERLSSSQPPLVIDVRSAREREQKHIDGSLSIPLNRLAENLTTLRKNRALLVYCASGYRSSIAASLLQGGGFAPVGEIAGGIAAWEGANFPVSVHA